MKIPKCIDLLCFIRRRLLCISYHNVLPPTTSPTSITRSRASQFVQYEYLTLYLEQNNSRRNGKQNANTVYIYTNFIHGATERFAEQT